jgi:hypothetical protein
MDTMATPTRMRSTNEDRSMNNETKSTLYGVIAEFETPEALIAASRLVREAGYKKVDAFTPFPVEELSEAIGIPKSKVPMIMLIGGICGGTFAFSMQWFAFAWSYVINIAGRPSLTWPMYIPITFEGTILICALSGIAAMIIINKLPSPYHPVFNAPNFERASTDRFFLCVQADDPKFDRDATMRFMENLGANQVSEVEEEH